MRYSTRSCQLVDAPELINCSRSPATTSTRSGSIGTDGNAFALLGKARRAARRAGWSEERWQEVQDEAMSGDYDHLLATLDEHFDVT